jgi:hypothetical protein|tara:strand:+ start:980 stop:1174 length:195 start_codon:yes stop_codon:yes gene_type:complete
MAIDLDLEEDLEIPKDLTEFIAFLGFILNEHKVDISVFHSTVLKELLRLIEQELKDRDKNSVIH